jgi:hypothetical protein
VIDGQILSGLRQKSCPPSLFKKHKGIGYFEVPAGARGQRRALRNHKAVVFLWNEAGLEAFRLSLRKPFGFAQESGNPGRCFRKSRRHPRAQSKFFPQRKISKEKGGKEAEIP